MKINIKTKLVNASVVCFLVLVLVFGIWTYIHAEGSVITACVKSNGLVYVIGDGFKQSDCHSNDQLLSWNIQGPKGDKGDKGDTGIQGVKGDKGDPGLSVNVTDLNGQKLGVFMSENHWNWDRIFIPSLNGWVDIDPSSGLMSDVTTHETSIPVYFSSTDCTGQGGIKVRELLNDLSLEYDVNMIIDAGNASHHRFFKADMTPPRFYPLNSRLYKGECLSEYDSGLAQPAVEVSLPFSLPVPTPLLLKSGG